jgi:hypothetical protein
VERDGLEKLWVNRFRVLGSLLRPPGYAGQAGFKVKIKGVRFEV